MASDKKNICVVTGTRAEYGLLRPLLFRFKDMVDVELSLIVTGTHLSSLFGNTRDEIIADGFSDYISVEIPLNDDSAVGMTKVTGIAIEKFAEVFEKYKPDVLVVLGDRYEIFAAVIAAHFIGIPVAHMCGGDVTEGAVDDSIRHSITKMSYLHFPCCEQSAKRIIQMGEQPNRVFNVGDPGIENCINMDLLSRQVLSQNLQFQDILGEYSVVTFHPVTLEDDTAEQQVYELINAMDAFPNMSYVITLANADAGGRKINEIWSREKEKRNNWLVVSSLGVLRYLSCVKYAKLVIGNSSSGMSEAPAFKVPTINIGDRQKGRMVAKSVVCCTSEKENIIRAMEQGLSAEFREEMIGMELPFGCGDTSERVSTIIMDVLKQGKIDRKKTFYDL